MGLPHFPHGLSHSAAPSAPWLAFPDLITGLALIAALIGAYARTIAPSITWANGGADSGDLVTAAATWGVAHPTGYPTYLLLARLLMIVPLGDLAFRATLLSAAAATLAALCVYTLVRRLLEQRGWEESLVAGLATLALGFSPLFWSQAVIAEVYALNALFVALILHWTLDAARCAPPSRWVGRVRPLVMGVMLGNHVTLVLPVAAWALASVAAAPVGTRLRLLGRAAGWGALGLLVYAYLPLAAQGNPPVNWGDPRDWASFWPVATGRLYGSLAFGLPPERLAGRISAWANLLSQQFGWVGLVGGVGGLIYAPHRNRRFLALTALVALGYSLFAIGYASDDSDAYLLPAFLIFALWLGLGLGGLLQGVRTHWRFAPLLLAPLAALLLWHVPVTLREVDASQDRGAANYAVTVMSAAPPHALLVTSNDLDSFPLWYYHYALGRRPDLVVVVEPLLGFPWYRANLRARGELHIPDVADDWVDALVAANPALGPVCRTDISRAPPFSCDTSP